MTHAIQLEHLQLELASAKLQAVPAATPLKRASAAATINCEEG